MLINKNIPEDGPEVSHGQVPLKNYHLYDGFAYEESVSTHRVLLG